MAIKTFFEDPQNYPGKFDFHYEGGAPSLIKDLINHIKINKEDLIEINLCWYLYNNIVLHKFLKELSIEGIIINIITIPLEGYDDNNPKKLKLKNGKFSDSAYTKYDIAKMIFKEVYHSENLPNYNLYFFPHLFVRSSYVKKFSRGSLPYSLHIKGGFLKKKNGNIIILSSSNMAVRDLVKYESMVLIEDEKSLEKEFEIFFTHLLKNSIPIKDFTSSHNTQDINFDFEDSPSTKQAFFTSPFYYDSANLMEEDLNRLILKAKNRIIICAQHLAAFNYEFSSFFHSQRRESEKRKGILGTILEMAKHGVDITCLSQTFSPPPASQEKFKGLSFRSPINSTNFSKFFTELEKTGKNKYYVNQNIHSKFIIIDQILIFCTYNFTPTQFTYLDSVKIDKFEHMADLSYNGIHCEIAAHVVIEDEQVIKSFEDHISSIIQANETVKVL